MENDIADYLKIRAAKVNSEIMKYLTDKTSMRYLETLLGKSGYEYDIKAIDKAILEPARYLFGLGGKRWRSVLMLTVIDALGKDSEDYIEFSIIPEVIHNGTIMHDDIEDGSELRRGSPAVHMKFGLDVALNLGDFMFFFPIIALLDSAKLKKDTKIKMLEVYHREMVKLSIGQATDIAWHRAVTNPNDLSEMHYLQMAYSKTGVLASMATKMGAVLAGADDKVIEAVGLFGSTIGVAFQLQDDLLNMSDSKLADLKGGVGEDITEGKITLLAIKTMERADDKDKRRLASILKMHTKDREIIEEAVSIIKKYKAAEYIKGLEWEMMRDAWTKLGNLLPESDAKSRLKQIAEFLIERSI